MLQNVTAQLSKINANYFFDLFPMLGMKGLKSFPIYEIKLRCLKQDTQQKVRMKLNTIKYKSWSYFLSRREFFLSTVWLLYAPLWVPFGPLSRTHPLDLNLFHAYILFLYPLKWLENLWFSVFRGYRYEQLVWNALTIEH